MATGSVHGGAAARAEPSRAETIDLEAMKRRLQAMSSQGDFGVIGTKLLLTAELLCEAMDLRAGERGREARAPVTCKSLASVVTYQRQWKLGRHRAGA